MQQNPQQKYSSQSRPGNQGDRSGGWIDRRWSEEKAMKEIKESFGENFVDDILGESKSDNNAYIKRIKTYVQNNKSGITTSQLRNVFSKVKNINDCSELYTLRPKLAYVSGRADKDEMKTLLFLLDELLIKVSEQKQLEQLKQFKNFFEAVIAYHKYFGGKD